MITKICSVILAVCLLAVTCLAADKPISDDVIVDQVRIKLAGDQEVKGGALKVDCKQGVVTIAGSVDTESARGKAAKLAKKVKGVKDVINNITVKK
jgi:hyperosmotically inducible periplasmic protein